MLDPSIVVGTGQPGVDAGPVVSEQRLDEVTRRAQSAEATSRVLASVIEVLSFVDSAPSARDAAARAVSLLIDALSAERVWVAWRGDAESCQVLADSEIESDPEERRLIESAAEEVAVRGGLTVWPTDRNRDRHSLLAVAQFARAVSASTLVAIPLVDAQRNRRGSLIAINRTKSFDANAGELLETIAHPLSNKLSAVERNSPGRFESVLRAASGSIRGKKKSWGLVGALAVVAVMLLPIRYRISADCELQPVQRRYVAAPFDGPLEEALVRPGDVVVEGDLLARINPREIEYELAGVRADLSRAHQEKKGLIVEHDFAGSKIAALEAERLRLETELLEYRRDNLEIRSPLDGIVVSGDLKQSEGAPLSRGETMFEIAPLGEMIVEISLDERDFVHAREGMPVRFFVHSLADRRFEGTLRRVHPHAELRDHQNVFIAEVRVTDSDGVLRPGMRGQATVVGDRHPLGWNLFHKAYHSLRATLGW